MWHEDQNLTSVILKDGPDDTDTERNQADSLSVPAPVTMSDLGALTVRTQRGGRLAVAVLFGWGSPWKVSSKQDYQVRT